MPRFLKFKLLLIFFLAFGLRLYGLNWDQGQHLHPDERFLTMVAADIKLPSSPGQYFHPSASPLNPYRYPGYQFFVYGTFPLFLTKFIAEILHLGSYGQVYLVGRVLSAFFDSLNLICLYYLAIKLIPKRPILPSCIYAFAVLPLQLSHFFTVDTFLTFFLTLTFTLLSYQRFFLAAVALGFAFASKVSAIYFLPIFFLFILTSKKNFLYHTCWIAVYSLLIAFLVFRLFQPYSFTGLFAINPQFINSLKTLKSLNHPFYPPAVQWVTKSKLIFPLENILFWGLGLPLSLALFKFKFQKNFHFLAICLWVVCLFLIQGLQFSYTMRYFLPLYPFFCLIAAFYITRTLLALHLLWAFLFLSIYSRPHSRIQASQWIYSRLPPNSQITHEYWDDPLPLHLSGQIPDIYRQTTLDFYGQDTPQKWAKLNPAINSADYLILSSNRLWGSIPQAAKYYPYTAKFYQDLFSSRLNFRQIASFTSYPGLPLPFLKSCVYFGPTNYPGLPRRWADTDPGCLYPGIYFRDDAAEEAFTVYDHPQVLIFARTR